MIIVVSPINFLTKTFRNFPEITEIIEKLESGECYTRSRSINSSSEVWSIFEEVAYSNSQEFTGIVKCKMCHFMTRYHGQITGTSHMRRHTCFTAMTSSNESSTGKNFTVNCLGKSLLQLITTSTQGLHVNLQAPKETRKEKKSIEVKGTAEKNCRSIGLMFMKSLTMLKTQYHQNTLATFLARIVSCWLKESLMLSLDMDVSPKICRRRMSRRSKQAFYCSE